MLVFLDTEFTDFVRPDLISIALVSEDGQAFYAERTDYCHADCSDFVRQTVQPLLGRVPGAACSRSELTGRVRDWFTRLSEPATIIFDNEWDWHLLAVAMLGQPHRQPPGDFANQLYLSTYTITHPVFERAQSHLYTQDWPPHYALADARALMAGYRAWHKFMHRTPCRIGSPAVNSASSAQKFSSSVATLSINCLRPPPFFEPGLARDRLQVRALSDLCAPSLHPCQTGPRWR